MLYLIDIVIYSTTGLSEADSDIFESIKQTNNH